MPVVPRDQLRVRLRHCLSSRSLTPLCLITVFNTQLMTRNRRNENVQRSSSTMTNADLHNKLDPHVDLRLADFENGSKFSADSPLVNVPPELITSILSYLEDDTFSLLSCSLTNKHLSFAARGVLVRTVVLDAPTGEDLHRKYAAFRQLLLGSSSPNGSSLVRSIRSLCLRFGKGVSSAENQDNYQLEKDTSLPSTLSLIVSLKSLTIHSGSDRLVTFPTVLRPTLLTLFASPSLRNLELRGIKRMDDTYLRHFTNLKHLSLADSFLKFRKTGDEVVSSPGTMRKCPLESLSVSSCHKLIFRVLSALNSSLTSAFDISQLRVCQFLFPRSYMHWDRDDRGIAAWNTALLCKTTLEIFHWHWHPCCTSILPRIDSTFSDNLSLHKGSIRPLCIDLAMLPSLRHLSIALEPTLFHDGALGNTSEVLDFAAPGNVIECVEIGLQLSVRNANRSFTCEEGKGCWMQLDACLASRSKFRCLEKVEIILFLKSGRRSIGDVDWYRDMLMLQFPLLLERDCGVFRVAHCDGEMYFFD